MTAARSEGPRLASCWAWSRSALYVIADSYCVARTRPQRALGQYGVPTTMWRVAPWLSRWMSMYTRPSKNWMVSMNGSKPGLLYWRDHWRRWKRMPRGYWIFIAGFMAGVIFEAVTHYV